MHFNAIWHSGYADVEKSCWDARKTSKVITSALAQLSKVEAQYAAGLNAVLANFKLPPESEDGTLLNQAWTSFLAGYCSIGNEHDKLSELLKSEGEVYDSNRHAETDTKRRLVAAAQHDQKDVAAKDGAYQRCRANYSKAVQNYDLSIKKRDEALVEDKKGKSNVDKLNTVVLSRGEQYTECREAYLDAVLDMQAAQLVFRDKMIQHHNDFETLETTRILATRDMLNRTLDATDLEVKRTGDILAAMRKYIAKIDEKEDINKFVLRHKRDAVPTPIVRYEPLETSTILVNLSCKPDEAPPTPAYPEGFEVVGFQPYVRSASATSLAIARKKSKGGLFSKLRSSSTAAAPSPAAMASLGSSERVPYVPGLAGRESVIRATALYDFVASAATELPFVAGDIITVTSQPEGDWWIGSLNGEIGEFPSNYVALEVESSPFAEVSSSAAKEPATWRSLALYDYHAIDATDLSFAFNDVLWVQDSTDPDWYFATNESGLSGMVPKNYVELQST